MSESLFTTRRRMTPPPVYESSRRITQNAPGLKPYLTLPYLLSLTWLAYPLLSLLFIAFRLRISSASAQDAVADAKGNLLTSCLAAEKAATAAASLPRFMAAASNKQISDAVNGTMNAARVTLVLALTILEGVLNFVIDIYRSTFFCFLELVVQGGLSIIIGAVQEFNSFLSGTFSGLRTSIQGDIQSANSVIKTAIDGINKVNPFGDITAPQITVPSLDSLQNVTLPSDFENALLKLNSSIPSVGDVKNAIQDVIAIPFEDVKKNINDTFAGISFDASTLPVPEQQTVSFCDQMDTSVVDDLGRDLLKAAQIGFILLLVIAVLLLAGYSAIEWYKWRCLKQHLEYTRQAWVTDPTMQNAVIPGQTPSLIMTDHNLMVLSASSSHPLVTRIANRCCALLKLSPSQQTNLHWFFQYVFHPPALACFLIGFLGLLSVQLQLIAIKPLEAKYNQQVSQSVSDFSNTIALSVNESMNNQSSAYATDINTRIETMQSTINDGLFGWVNGTTNALNTTLNNFYDDVQNAVTFVFNGTVLENPMQQFVFCIIGTKVEAIENAITFLHDNLIVDLPKVNQSVLVLSQANVDEATQPIAQAAIGGGNGDNSGLVGKLISRYVSTLKQERIMFFVFIGLWFIVVFMAICIVWWHSYGKQLFESKEKRRWREQRTAGSIDSFVFPPPQKPTFDISKEEKNIPPDADVPPPFAPSLIPAAEAGFANVTLREPMGRRSGESEQIPRPAFERSWDSFLDSSAAQQEDVASTQQQGSTLRIGAPRKLMAIGRKAIRKERFVSDEERDRERALSVEDDDEGQQGGWWKKMTSVFRGRKEEDVEDSSSQASSTPSSTRPRVKPNLTIATGLDFSTMARDQLPTAGGVSPARSPARSPNPPATRSHWSVSPVRAVQPVPWSSGPRTAGGRNLSVQRPNYERKLSVPASVNSSGENSFPSSPIYPVMDSRSVPQTPRTPNGVPSYYQSNVPNRFQRDSLLPDNIMNVPRVRHRSASGPMMFNVTSPAKLATIHEPALTPRGNKHLSHVADPFSTPFDDDARVPPMPASNPFFS